MSGVWCRLSGVTMMPQIWNRIDIEGGNHLLSHPHSPPFWEKKNLKSIRSKVLWAPQGHQQVCGRDGILVWILTIPPSVLFPVPQTSFSLPGEPWSVLTSTKDHLSGINLSSPFDEVHSNSGGLWLKKETWYLYNIFHSAQYFHICGLVSLYDFIRQKLYVYFPYKETETKWENWSPSHPVSQWQSMG